MPRPFSLSCVFLLLAALLLLLHTTTAQSPTGSYRIRFLVGGLAVDETVRPSQKPSDFFDVEVHPEWAPLGAARLHALVQAKFFEQARFFRVIPGFMAQFGLPAMPSSPGRWPTIRDEPVKAKNTRGRLSFAKTSSPDSRDTQFFINTGDNSQLDKQGFSPIGEVVDGGMAVVDRIFADYRELPVQDQIRKQGNSYLKLHFEKLSFIGSVQPLPSHQQATGEPPASSSAAQGSSKTKQGKTYCPADLQLLGNGICEGDTVKSAVSTIVCKSSTAAWQLFSSLLFSLSGQRLTSKIKQ